MLTREQQSKLNVMVHNYRIGMRNSFKADALQVECWVKRYRIKMERELQTQDKL